MPHGNPQEQIITFSGGSTICIILLHYKFWIFRYYIINLHIVQWVFNVTVLLKLHENMTWHIGMAPTITITCTSIIIRQMKQRSCLWAEKLSYTCKNLFASLPPMINILKNSVLRPPQMTNKQQVLIYFTATSRTIIINLTLVLTDLYYLILIL